MTILALAGAIVVVVVCFAIAMYAKVRHAHILAARQHLEAFHALVRDLAQDAAVSDEMRHFLRTFTAEAGKPRLGRWLCAEMAKSKANNVVSPGALRWQRMLNDLGEDRAMKIRAALVHGFLASVYASELSFMMLTFIKSWQPAGDDGRALSAGVDEISVDYGVRRGILLAA